jgi:transposase
LAVLAGASRPLCALSRRDRKRVKAPSSTNYCKRPIAPSIRLTPKRPNGIASAKPESGIKSDHLDAWSFADALRLDGLHWKPLCRQDPLVEQLRLLCRDEVALIEERTALVNQLQAALHEYYPTALAAFEDWTLPAAWAFIEAFSTPQALASAGKRRGEKFLHTHKLARPETYQKRLELFAKALEFCGSEPLTQAKSRLALTRARQLRVLQAQLDDYRQQIEKLFAQHPDHDLFGSLPGTGPKLAPRLLAELGDNRQQFASAQALQCYAGTAPVSYQSGPVHQVRLRGPCDKALRATVYLWADCSRYSCPWAQTYYQSLRQRGKTHACALRCLSPALARKSCGRCGKRAPATTRSSTRKTSSNTVPGCSSCKPLNRPFLCQ